MSQRIEQLEKRVAELEKKVAAATTTETNENLYGPGEAPNSKDKHYKEDEEFILCKSKEIIEMICNLKEKMSEARFIATELSKTEITIRDTRQKDIADYISEIKRDFTNAFGFWPSQYFLVAEGDSLQCRLLLSL